MAVSLRVISGARRHPILFFEDRREDAQVLHVGQDLFEMFLELGFGQRIAFNAVHLAGVIADLAVKLHVRRAEFWAPFRNEPVQPSMISQSSL